jgi:hypothetical protein
MRRILTTLGVVALLAAPASTALAKIGGTLAPQKHGNRPSARRAVSPAAVPMTLSFSACIDGSDEVHIKGNQLWYVHKTWLLPGQHPDCPGDGNLPTYINGAAWYPVWNGNVSQPTTIPSALRSHLQILSWSTDRDRVGAHGVTVLQKPTRANQREGVFLIDDDAPLGPAWYTISVGYMGRAS